MANLCFAIFVTCVLFLLDSPVQARKHSPLIGDENSHGKNRAAECTFGKQIKEIGSSWFADLGPPFGVMYCIKCECIKVQKKRRIVARVQCRNIKNECPKLTCDNPVLLPGSCCKSCPGDFNTPVPSDNPSITADESMKHYASLLTGRSSLVVQREDMLPVPVSINKNNVIATGRFTFHHKNLYYSFYVSDKAARPRFLQFVDDMGNILDEHTLSGPGIITSLYQNVTRKICGVWRRLPKDYRRLLKDQKLFAVLVWGLKDQPEFTLSGQIMRYVALGTELFSSLLEPAIGSDAGMMAGAGGTAIVSTSSTSTPSIHIAIVFNGIFAKDELADVPVNITLALEEKQQIIIEEVKRIDKPAHELNMIEVSSPVSPAEMRLLTRGRLVLSISSVSKPEALRLSGAVMTRATCELFQAPLTSSNSEKDHSLSHPSGLAWMFMNSEGALVYHIQVDQVNQPVSLISLVDVSVKRKTELADLTADYKEGWANGTLDRLGPRFLEPLYSGNLAVNIALENQNTITGRLIAKPVAEARDASAPVLLKRVSNQLPSSVVGLGWFSVDNNCHIHYDLTLTGMANYKKVLQLYLLEIPMIAPGAPITTRTLEEFKGNQVENTANEVHDLTDEDSIILNSGVAYLEIREKESRNVLLKGIIRQVLIPSSCLPHYSSDNTLPAYDPARTMNGGPYPPSQPPPPKTCYHEGRFYEENSDWSTTDDPCRVCFCQNGQVRCQMATCPVQSCPGGTRFRPAVGECCGPCSNVTDLQSTNSRGCHLGKYFHSAGSKWHPFLIPNGFDRCIECHCNPDTLSVNCSKLSCESANIDSGTMSDGIPSHQILRSTTPNPNDILSAGGCKHGRLVIENGTEFHPKIQSIGEYKCVTCKCKDGIVNCERLKCIKSCNNTTYRQRRNSIENANIKKCCSCKRLRRHQHHRNHGQS